MAGGNIPAHAGKTIAHKCDQQKMEEHPRTRGENISPRHTGYARGGTSPHTRGKLEFHYLLVGDVRNIPAHAGKTDAVIPLLSDDEEHPRTRGENLHRGGLSPLSGGTSPHTRGKPP